MRGLGKLVQGGAPPGLVARIGTWGPLSTLHRCGGSGVAGHGSAGYVLLIWERGKDADKM